MASILDKPGAAGVALAVLDCGLTAEQAVWCRHRGARVVGVAAGPIHASLIERTRLPQLLPGHDIYVWLDSDTWLQSWRPVELLVEGASLGPVAAVPEIHRSYRNYRDGWDEFRAVNGAAFRKAFGRDTGDRLMRRPLINAGAFAMRAASPLWAAWQRSLDLALASSSDMVDQVALNHAIYEGGFEDVRLPATCNWIVHHATPAWDETTGLLVEPALPFEPMGLVHLTLGTKWEGERPVATARRRGEQRSMSLRYPGLRLPALRT